MPNLPAVIESDNDSADEASNREPLDRPRPNKPYGGIDPKDSPPGYAMQHDSALNKNSERRCVAKNSRGQQCRKFAIYGGTVCRAHGGPTRQVKEKARIRVEMHSNALMGKLIEIAYGDTRPAAVQLDAIKDSLNRAGIVKPTQVEVGPIKPHEEIFDAIATGSRSDYRERSGFVDGRDDSPDLYESGQISHREHGEDDPSPAHTPHPATWADADCDPLSARERGEPGRATRPQGVDQPRRSQGRPAVTGDEAIRIANQANGLIDPDVFGLPPGRSSHLD